MIAALCLIVLHAPTQAQDPAPSKVATPGAPGSEQSVPQAKAAANAWLALTDAGEFEASWDQSSTLFKTAVTNTQWHSALQAVRLPLGAVKSRVVMSAIYKPSLPGAPDGDYVVIQFETAFENKADAIETVTPHRESDGSWKVAGYFIR